MMKSHPSLEKYQQERNHQLEALLSLLQGDGRVRAAWLMGSLGSAQADALSDLDVFVVLADQGAESLLAQLRRFTAQIGDPLFFLEGPQNAPEGGAYLMTCYDAPLAPHIIDWYFQLESRAYIPTQVHLLFDRAGLEHKNQPLAFPGVAGEPGLAERPEHFIGFFWMMLMITAKYTWREPYAEALQLLPYLLEPLAKAHRFAGRIETFRPDVGADLSLPAVKMGLLYRLADQMSEIMPAIAARGIVFPERVPQAVCRFLDLIASNLPRGGKPAAS